MRKQQYNWTNCYSVELTMKVFWETQFLQCGTGKYFLFNIVYIQLSKRKTQSGFMYICVAH